MPILLFYKRSCCGSEPFTFFFGESRSETVVDSLVIIINPLDLFRGHDFGLEQCAVEGAEGYCLKRIEFAKFGFLVGDGEHKILAADPHAH